MDGQVQQGYTDRTQLIVICHGLNAIIIVKTFFILFQPAAITSSSQDLILDP